MGSEGVYQPTPMEVHMQKMIVLALIAGAVLRSDPVLVTRVTSGSSITVASVGRVVLLGIEAPPTGRARDRLEALVVRRWVRLEYDDATARQSSMHRAYVMLETGECINLTLVGEGLARVARRGQFARRAEFERAEEEARRFRRGLWARYTALSGDRMAQLPDIQLPSPSTNQMTNQVTNPITNPITNPVTNPITNPITRLPNYPITRLSELLFAP
jgi:endonuclease YncB( thermonuclease family)